jgi:iron complex transport system ATP-binding protein
MTRASGRIEVAGRPVAKLTHRALARLIAFVPQHPVLPPQLTGLEYVLLGRTPHIGYFSVESARDRRICGTCSTGWS